MSQARRAWLWAARAASLGLAATILLVPSGGLQAERAQLVSPTVEFYLSPDGGAEAAILREIGRARESIYVAMYSFNNRRLAEALVAARRRGVRVYLVADQSQSNPKNKTARKQVERLDALAAAGVEVRISQAFSGWPRGGIMHLKLAVIDREVIILGSYNWTDPAERRNKEILEIKRSRKYAERLIGEIEAIR